MRPVPRGGTDELVVDLEKGQLGHRHRHREEDPPPATVADALFARDEEIGTTADKAIKCILRVSIFMYSCICVGFICLLAGSDISIVLKS